jgi:malonyl-CoA O-methyltransferase
MTDQGPYRRLQFDRAAERYDLHSGVQRSMAEKVLSLLEGVSCTRFMELGCGTGHLTSLVLERLRPEELVVTDVAERMLATCRERFAHTDSRMRYHLLDARSRSIEAAHVESFDAAGSNAMAQWFSDLAAHFELVRALLRPLGHYALSGLTDSNFPELRSVLEAAPFRYGPLPGHALSGVRACAEQAGLSVLALSSESLHVTYPSTSAFLAAIRATGASRFPADKRLTPSRLSLLKERYDAAFTEVGGVRATWTPWYALLRRAQ